MLLSASLPPPSSSPSSVGISVGGVSLDLRPLMLTAADLLRLTTKQAADKLSPPEAEPEEGCSGRLRSGKTSVQDPGPAPAHKAVHVLMSEGLFSHIYGMWN